MFVIFSFIWFLLQIVIVIWGIWQKKRGKSYLETEEGGWGELGGRGERDDTRDAR